MTLGRIATPLSERFWRFVCKDAVTGCWNWAGFSYNESGYGGIRSDTPPYKKVRAHRVSWELHNGPIPDGVDVLHRCDNPKCVNPDHLYLGSQADNMRDMIERGLWEPPNRSMSKQAAEKYREMYKSGGLTYVQLAKIAGVAESTIGGIIRGDVYK